MKLPIVAGPLRGRWWLPASRGKVVRILSGTYEPAQTRLFRESVRPGDTVLDVGTHAGYYTLLSAVLVGAEGAVWGFEPDERNAMYARRHLVINGFDGARVEGVAVSERSGTAAFAAGRGSGTGRLAPSGSRQVPTVSLDDFCADRRLRPSVVKLDVEGAEAAALRGAATVLRDVRPLVFLSTHGPDVHEESLSLLLDLGYRVRAIGGGTAAMASELFCRPADGPDHGSIAEGAH